MKRCVEVLVFLAWVSGVASADIVGPLVREQADFPGFAIFQINAAQVKRGDKVTVQRQRRPLINGKVTEIAGGRCMVKFDQPVPLLRGDLLHKRPKNAKNHTPGLGTSYQRKPIVRTRLSTQLGRKQVKSGRSPHVLTPAEFASQSRRSSVSTMGQVMSVEQMAGQTRRTSVFTMGRAMSVKEMATKSRSTSAYTLGRSLTVKEFAKQSRW